METTELGYLTAQAAMQEAGMDPQLLTAADIGKRLGRSAKTVERMWKVERSFPPPDLSHRGIELWRVETFDAWFRLWPWFKSVLKARTGTDRDGQTRPKRGQMKTSD